MATRRKLITVILAALFVLGFKIMGPYLLVVNSVPGQISLTEEDRLRLLNATIARIEPVSEAYRERVIQTFAGRSTDNLALNERSGVVRLSQTILASFKLNLDIDQCNQLLQKIVVWGRAGSSWALHKTGDYDFALVWMTSILYEFGDNEDILYPQTRDYLLNTLLTEQGRLNRMVPRSGGLIFDTENHLLMREGSRYLKNQWLKVHGTVPAHLDNDKNGLGDWLEQYLNHMRLKGTYEYNSTPYVVYSLLPLMNLADYAESKTIRGLAESILDNIALRFAYGSFHLRQCAPFRRQFKYAEDPSLLLNRYHRYVEFQLDPTTHHDDLLVFASVFHDYTLPLTTYERLVNRDEEDYFALFAHEQKGSPEIYSGGKHYLLTAGGAYRGEGAKVIARPIALLLDDAAEMLSDCIHIEGKGHWKQWNMTGVHRRFAIAKGRIFLPERYQHAIIPGWNLLRANDNITVAFYQGPDLVILLVLPDIERAQDDLLRMLKEKNPAPEKSKQFFWPEAIAPDTIQSIRFHVDADSSNWAITAVDGNGPTPMKTTAFERWPFVLVN
ncbi:hypothetical protein ACFL6U_20170 [Planctomycetota bacterium]